ncbi:MAG: hypothetical protein QOH49_1071, partial [Acidobacteriota bacterium]|nr:hypothetical protein [Acidobacteriota bacterium]
LDPEYPEGRLRFMAEDAGLSVLLTGGKLSELAAALAQGAGAAVVHLDELGDEPPGVEEARPRAAMSPDNLAYVIYTSGSTGRPKGVAIEHRSAAALLHWAHEIFDPEELSGTLASTSVCFDLSVFEIFAPLGRGGTVILARDALHLPTLAARESVTLINTVPSAMAELVRQGAVPASVRAVNLAGEVLKNSLAQAVYGQGGVRRVFNLYGPSEDTTYSTWSLVGRGSGREPTIGRPIANTCAYVLDGRMRPAPLGVPGELFLGGAGLARDYLRRPALTAERFVPDPFSAELGARLYRTGDLARWLPSGELEFLGRVDHQVKVRGFRIELGEVEAALLSQPGVRQAVVLAREAGADNQRLVAYVTGDREAFKAADVRRGLKERLPGYMVPSSFVLLEEWPLTPSGKVDRRRLPAPDESAWEDGKAFESPRTPVEDILASIYEQVLGVRDIGVHANFFELGGHSLLATQVVSRLNDAFNLEVPLHALFESPTVAALAEHVEAAIAGGRLSAAKPLVRAPRGVAPTLSYQQRRLWFLGQLEPEDPSYNMAGALRLKGPLDAGALEWSFNEVVSRHEALRTAFVEVNGVPVPSVEPVTRLTLPSYDLSALPEGAKQERLDAFLREEAERPFDLKRCPLLRLRLLRLAEDEHVLQLTMHHIISDGWSLGVLLRELKTFYESRTAGQPAELRELPVQYADYALWQRERLEGGELERQLAYWEARLAGLPEALELPTDRPRRPSPRRRGGVVEFSLPTGLTTSLKSLARREGATLFMTLLAGFEALLYRHTGQELFAVGTPVAGRGREEVRGLIGFFVNTLALRAEVSGGETFAELLGRVRGEALGGYGHQEAPFERVVERLSPARSLGRSPIFQVMLTLDNTPQEELKLGALRVERLPSDGGAAKYDLSLSLREEGGVLGAMLSYDAGLFDEATVRSLAERYEVLLEGAAADPARRISEVPLLTEEEAHRQLVEWNETRRDYPAEATIHGLFERQARRTPDALALVFEGERLTYAQ